MLNYFVVDAFTRTRLEGNPVAVFLECDGVADVTMQAIAREMNLSETTFIRKAETGGDFAVRIFTPVNELPFAGHPLLGTAIALSRVTERTDLLLETRIGMVPLSVVDHETHLTASMEQPIPTWVRFDRESELLAALGIENTSLPIDLYRNGPRHAVVVLNELAELSTLNPDHRALGSFSDMAINCVASSGRNWRNRMFSPAYGVVEDPATGSAAGPIAIHLARYGRASYGQELCIEQGFEIGRRSLMMASVRGTGDSVDGVRVFGDGAMTCSGSLWI
jgi:trans-2,3-dihydro-3-hydroxyanthranilate isomerase